MSYEFNFGSFRDHRVVPATLERPDNRVHLAKQVKRDHQGNRDPGDYRALTDRPVTVETEGIPAHRVLRDLPATRAHPGRTDNRVRGATQVKLEAQVGYNIGMV